MFNNLNAEMKRANLKLDDIAKELGVTNRTMRNKRDGVTQFTRTEMFTIRDKFFPNLGVEYLFLKYESLEHSDLEFEEQ